MTQAQGKFWLLQASGIPAAGQYTTIAKQLNTGMTINNTEVDNTNKDSGGWRDIFTAGSIKQVGLTCEAVVDSTAGQNFLRSAAFSSDPVAAMRIVDDVNDFYIAGNFHVASLEMTGGTEGFVNASYALNSTGVIATGTVNLGLA